MRYWKTATVFLGALTLSACASIKPFSKISNAAMRAGGVAPPTEAEAEATTKAEAEKPHWSEDWVWGGDEN